MFYEVTLLNNDPIRSLFREDYNSTSTARKMNFSIQDFFSKCGQICRKLRFLSHLLKKSSMENFIFCVQCSVEEDFPSQFNFVASKTVPPSEKPNLKNCSRGNFSVIFMVKSILYVMFNIFKVYSIFRS